MKKRCTKCGNTRLLDDFYGNKRASDGKDSWCKECRKIVSREWAKSNADKAREYKRGWNAENPDRVKEYQARSRKKIDPDKRADQNLRRKYGIGLAKYDRMLEDQKGLCAVCELPLKDRERRNPVDHDHSRRGSVSVRGIVHPMCNALVGIAENDPALFDKVKRYVEKHS